MTFERSLFQAIEHYYYFYSLIIQPFFYHQISAMTRSSADTGRRENSFKIK